jgi:hypothetical protein
MQRRRRAVIALLALNPLGPTRTFAQQESAMITGEVRDASGAVVPTASVMVTDGHQHRHEHQRPLRGEPRAREMAVILPR